MGSISIWYNIICILISLLPNYYCRFDIIDWELILLTGGHNYCVMDQSQKIILTPFNLFEWKAKMEILLRVKGLYRVTMETEAEPNAVVEKISGRTGGMRPMVVCV